MTTIDITEFCSRFSVDPSHVVATASGIRIVGLPVAEADRVIVSMMAAGLIAWLDDPALAEEDEDDGIEIVEDEDEVVQPGGPAEAWARLASGRTA